MFEEWDAILDGKSVWVVRVIILFYVYYTQALYIIWGYLLYD